MTPIKAAGVTAFVTFCVALGIGLVIFTLGFVFTRPWFWTAAAWFVVLLLGAYLLAGLAKLIAIMYRSLREEVPVSEDDERDYFDDTNEYDAEVAPRLTEPVFRNTDEYITYLRSELYRLDPHHPLLVAQERRV